MQKTKTIFSKISFALLGIWVGTGLPTAASEANWTKDTAAGKAAYEQCNWGQAEKYFKASVKDAEEFGPKDIRLAESLTNLGGLYNFRSQSTKAAPIFERAIAIKQRALGAENPEVVASVGRLCQFYISHSDYAKAEPVGTKLAAFAQKTVHDRQAVTSSFAKLDSFYLAHKEYKEAEALCKKTEEETKKVGSNADLELAVVLDGLGESFKSSNKLSLSEQLYLSGLAIREQSLPPLHLAIAASCRHLGGLYMLEGKTSQAEPLLKRAVQINSKTTGVNKTDTLACMDELAACYQKGGHMRDAETLYKEQIETAEETYGGESKQTASAELAFASFLMKSVPEKPPITSGRR